MAYGCGYEDTMNKQQVSPLKSKGHPGDEKKGHGHKGVSYKRGDDLDEDIIEDVSDLNAQDVSSVQEDDESQFIVSLDDGERPNKTGKNAMLKSGQKRDTIRSQGPKFKRRY
jgi:hypothetical protein